MILSHEYQLLFIKTAKTAGTSIEISLSRYLGPLDVATTLAPEDEDTRMQLGRTAQNHMRACRVAPAETLTPEGRLEFLRNREFDVALGGLFYNHIPANTARSMIGERTWQRVFKFCVERNPYDRAISAFFYNGGPEKFESFGQFLRSRGERTNADIYCIDNQVAVDWIIRYEDLAASLPKVLDRVGLDFDGWLPHAKSHFRTDHTPWQDFLSADDKRLVETKMARDLEVYESIPSRWPL